MGQTKFRWEADMHNYHPNPGPSARPFPHGKKSKALLAEDEFMRAHGGSGSVFIYRVVTALWPRRYWRKLSWGFAKRPSERGRLKRALSIERLTWIR